MAVGLSGTLVNLGLLWVLASLGMDHFLAALLATEVSIINNFIWNDCWTFKTTDPRGRSFLARFIRFQTFASITALMTLGLFSLFYQAFKFHYLLAQFCAIGFATLVNFSINSWLTWGLFAPARVALASIGGPLSKVTIAKEIEEC
jgi:dolichol-phosphate mannosyltransferase